MALRIEETFQVDAPADRVWQYLIDPRQVVGCLPGAELLEVEDDRTFLGQVKVKVGPITTAYKGRARFEEVDDAARQVRMTGEGRETGGAGSAKMTMSSQVIELPDGGTEIRVVSELDVVGRIVQFGRGMIEEVSRQIFAQFADCVRSTLATGEAATAGGPDATTTDAAEAPPDSAPAGSGQSGGARVRAAAGAEHASGTERPQAAPASGTPAGGAKPVKLLPILWTALLNRVRRLLGRKSHQRT